MQPKTDRRTPLARFLSKELAGLACAACCLVPLRLAAGVLGRAGWAALDHALPIAAVTLAASAGMMRWWAPRRKSHACGAGCSCTGTGAGC